MRRSARSQGIPAPKRATRRMSARARSSILLLTALLIGLAGWVAAEPRSEEVRAAEDPWSVPASWTVEEQEVEFESSGVRLVGTLFSPEGVEDGPAIVAVQQAGNQTRDVPLSVQMQKTLNAIGYSVFLYDRRGHGESQGDPGRPDYMTLAADAVAAKRAIAETDAVHPNKIGFWGLSQSGWLAMEAGAMSDPAFVISVAAPLTTPGEQMELLAHNYTLLHGHGEEAAREALELRRAVTGEYFRGERSYESARSLLAMAEDEPWFEWSFLPRAEALPEDVEASSWIHEKAYDPTEAFQAVDAPVLFLLGGEDFDVPVARTLEIAEDLGEREGREVVVIPGASHLMRIEDDPRDQFELEAHEVVSNSVMYFTVIGEWLGRLDLGPD